MVQVPVLVVGDSCWESAPPSMASAIPFFMVLKSPLEMLELPSRISASCISRLSQPWALAGVGVNNEWAKPIRGDRPMSKAMTK